LEFQEHYFTEKKKPKVNVYPVKAKAFNKASSFNSKKYDKKVHSTLDTDTIGENQPEK